jgi:hypothetical protein
VSVLLFSLASIAFLVSFSGSTLVEPAFYIGIATFFALEFLSTI